MQVDLGGKAKVKRSPSQIRWNSFSRRSRELVEQLKAERQAKKVPETK